MQKIIKEPLVHFLLLGLAIFIFYGIVNDDVEGAGEKIIIDDNDIDRLIQNYQKTWNEYPQEKTILTLVDDYIKSEVLYKEALQLNLDHNDEIIKRRLMQKYEFLIEDLADNYEVEEAVLKEYWQENRKDYSSPKILSFSHHYFNPDLVNDAEAMAKNNLRLAKSGKIKSHSSHLNQNYHSLEPSQIANIFGQEFSLQISELSPNAWHGPIKSGYGFHLVFISEIKSAKEKTYDEAKEEVARNYQDQFVDQQQEKLYEVLKERFDIDYQLEKHKSLFN